MLKYLQKYDNIFERELNKDLMLKKADNPLVEYIKDVWKSLEVCPAIKIVGFQYTEEESKIDVNRHIFKRDKKKKKKERYDYKYINDSRCGCLITTIMITLPVRNPKTKEVEIHQKQLKKSILIPIQDEDGYYTIKGKKYYMIYQLVEKSTYTGNQKVTLKSLMPILLHRMPEDREALDPKTEAVISEFISEDGAAKKVDVVKTDYTNTEYRLPVYYITMFKKEVPVILFFLANGVEWALDFLMMKDMISFVSEVPAVSEDELYFPISSKCYLRVRSKELFLKYPYIQSVVGGILNLVTNRMKPEDVMDTETWIKKLHGGISTKGNSMATFFNRLLDEVTKKILLLDDIHKRDIYSLIRWIMMNFNELRSKDNMNLYNKRIRCNEYISSLLTIEFSMRLNRVISMGNKANMDNYKEIFKFAGDIIFQKMHVSGILRFDDCINDMTFFRKFKVTFKGPHSQGNKDKNRINIKARGIHPSYLENFDILVCGNSDQLGSGFLVIRSTNPSLIAGSSEVISHIY